MKYTKSFLSLGIVLLLLLSLLAVPASANSAQMQWRGTDITGAIVTDEKCPIIVEQEVLTFDIGQFPETHYQEVSDYLAYSGSVTAEYTFYNPADYTVEVLNFLGEGYRIYEKNTTHDYWYYDSIVTVSGMCSNSFRFQYGFC